MPKSIKYIGTQDRWPELAYTGKQSNWRPGQMEQRSDSEAALLLATGQFADVDATQLPESKVVALSGVVSGDGPIPVLSFRAAGRSSAPVSTFNGATASGALGKPTDIKIPANTLVDGASQIRMRFRVRKVGTDASSYLQVHVGPSNGTADVNVFSASGITPQFTSTTPFDTTLTLWLTYKSGGFGVSLQRDVPNVGAGLSAGECTGIDPAVDNYINFAISGASGGNTYDLLAYHVEVFR